MTGGAHHQRGTPRRACRGRGSPPLPFRCPACRRRSGPTTLTCRGGETFSVAGRGSPPLPVPRPACRRRRRDTTDRSWGQTSSVAGRGSSPLPFQRPAIHRRSWATACAQPRVHVRLKKSANVMSGALSAHRAWAKRGAPRAARPLRAMTPTVERRTSVVPSLVPKCRKPVYLCPEAHALVQKSPPVAARHVGGCGRAAQDPDLPEGEAPPREGREMRPVRREARRFGLK